MTTPLQARSELDISIEDHQIVAVIPGPLLRANMMEVDGGVLLGGKFLGQLHSSRGSVILQASAKFAGTLVADHIFISGEVSSSEAAASHIFARQTLNILAGAKVHAKIEAPSVHVDPSAEVRAIFATQRLPGTPG